MESFILCSTIIDGCIIKKDIPMIGNFFKLNNNGYTFVKSFINRPDDETIILNL